MYTGTLGVLEYPNNINLMTPYYLMSLSSKLYLPVPKYMWTMVYNKGKIYCYMLVVCSSLINQSVEITKILNYERFSFRTEKFNVPKLVRKLKAFFDYFASVVNVPFEVLQTCKGANM